jgi:BASS family bile acid:Na+ symporter
VNLLIILLAVAVGLIRFGQGLTINLKDIITHTDRSLILRGVLTSVVFVPIVFLILILIFQPVKAIALAIIIMGISPAANLSTRQVEILQGDNGLAEIVQFISALMTIITAPILLNFFSTILELHVKVKFTAVIEEISVVQFAPVILSIVFRKLLPQLTKFGEQITKGASILLVISFIAIIIQKHAAFGKFNFNGYLAIIIATISAFLLGVLFAGKNARAQIALALESGMRNPGLGFLIARGAFPKERVDLAMVPYVVTIVGTIIFCTLLLKLFQKQFAR